MVGIEIVWANRKLEKSCSTDREGRRRWGAEHWPILQRRLATLRHVPTLEDMVGLPGNCHALGGDRSGEFAVSLWGSYRLTFEPAHDPVPRTADGGIDRGQVTSILIREVVDYHGD